jgi:formylglycine-generating enzyme required for sulfatase activity
MGTTARTLRALATALLATTFACVSGAQPASAQSTCFGDITGDALVDGADLAKVLSSWGPCPGNACGADLTGNGFVDAVDLAEVIVRWGYCAPSISTVVPPTGPPAGGTVVTITGSSLQTTTAVTIGGVPAASFTVLSATTLTAVTPPGSLGAKSVAVTNLGGTATKANGFTYLVPWFTVIESAPDPAVVTNAALRSAIVATGYPWRVRDNASQIEMLLVPPGTFQMGCIVPSLYYNCTPPERPVHTVTLTNAYYIGRYEVLQAEWQAVMGSNPSRFTKANGFPGSTTRPVEQVSWNTVQGFLTATGLRLPTEAEWERAYRAGTDAPFYAVPGYPDGSADDNIVNIIAWWYGNADFRSQPVGGKLPNALGLYDMAGNVWEWCSDYFGQYSPAAQTNPTGPSTGVERVMRGGSWVNGPEWARASGRAPSLPENAYDTMGFRVARTP